MTYSSDLGGSGSDKGFGIAVDGSGRAYVTGTTFSTNFPTVNAFQATNSDADDAFVTKIDPTAAFPVSDTLANVNPAENAPHACAADPINCATGNFSETYTDLAIPGRGPALALSRTYNAATAGTSGPLGYGWSLGYGMNLVIKGDGSATITQENGATVSFASSSGVFTPPAYVLATLVRNANGTYTFTRRQREIFTFSSAGKLLSEADLNGYTTTLGYNGSGQLATVTDPAGRAITLSYGANGLISGAADSGGRSVGYGYDANGNLTSVTDVNGHVTHFGYDAVHELQTITDPRGGVLTNTYNASGQVTRQQDPANRVTTLAYSNGTTTITDPVGNVTQETFSPQYELLSRTRAVGSAQAATWTFTYDPATLGIASVTDPNTHVTRATYDARGNVLTVTDALNRTTTNTYDNLDDLRTTTDPKGVTTTLTYDAHGNLISRSTPLVGASPAQAQVVSYTYGDAAHPGDVTSVVDPDGKTWSATYDLYGDQTCATDPLNDKTTSTFNTLGWQLAQVSPKGNVAGCNCTTQYTTTYGYVDPITQATNELGLVTTVTDPLGHQTTTAYDADNNVAQATDADGNLTTNTYNVDNQPTKVTRADQTTVQTSYTADGQTYQQIDGKGNATTFGYDRLGHVSTVTDSLNRTTAYSYDPVGNLRTKQDPSGSCSANLGCTTYQYDAADELASITYSDPQTPNVGNLTYDADGQRTGMSDGIGNSTWSWDSLHRLTISTDGLGNTVTYGYDLKGQLTSLLYPGQTTPVVRHYDNAGRLATVTDWLGNTTTFAYDQNSNLVGEAYPPSASGVVVNDNVTVDAGDRVMGSTVTSTAAPAGPVTLASYSYQRDGNDRMRQNWYEGPTPASGSASGEVLRPSMRRPSAAEARPGGHDGAVAGPPAAPVASSCDDTGSGDGVRRTLDRNGPRSGGSRNPAWGSSAA